jgi:uncharacterized glyoxalase superfamily protein PhnB
VASSSIVPAPRSAEAQDKKRRFPGSTPRESRTAGAAEGTAACADRGEEETFGSPLSAGGRLDLVPDLNAIGIVASDMATSIHFYRTLGLDVPDTPDEGHLEAIMSSGLRLMLDSEEVVKSFMPEWSRETGNQLSLAFECSSPAEVDELYARVTGAGFEGEKEPWDAFWGQRYALLRDPDGVEVNLYAALEGG